MAKSDKTNAVRILERAGIGYTTIEYPVDPDHLEASHVAEALDEPIERVFKTLVLRGNRTGIFVCIIAGCNELDLKKAARASGNKKAEMIAVKELLPLTGYIRGGCTAIGMKKPYPVFLSHEALHYDKIFISAGRRGLQICMSPSDLQHLVNATPADLIAEHSA